jgi:NAD(P)H-flavin reductase/hemoglobin-like flavoprotein
VSSTGSGSDQPHLVALLRAIRLRLAAPDAAEAGATDTAAALTDQNLSSTGTASSRQSEHPDESPHPDWVVHPHWPQAASAPSDQHQTDPTHPAPPQSTAGRTPDSPGSTGRHPAESAATGTNSTASNPPAAKPAPPHQAAGRSPATPRPSGTTPILPAPSGPPPDGPRPPRVGHPIPGDPVQLLGPVPPPVRPPAPAQAPTAGAAQPGDGMDPADDAALHEVQRLLSDSLSLAGGPAEVAGRLRAALLQAQPQLLATLPGGPFIQREQQLAAALTWLVHNLEDPPVLAAGCAQLGAALAECGVQPRQLQLVGAALAEAIRAGLSGGVLRQDFDLAWRTTWQHAHKWISQGAALTGYEPTRWTAVVVSHDLRRHDLAIVRLRPYLPMPFRPGQYTRIEVPELPGVWRPYSLAGAPRRDDVVELHVRAKTLEGVSGTLVHRTDVGDKVRLARPEGYMGLPERPERDLLLIAGDTGVAPLKALLTELAATGDSRSAVLFWGARTLDELYDIDEIAEIARACKRATVVPVISEGNPGPYASGLVTDAVAAYGEWSEHEVYLAGPPLMLAATSAALHQLRVSPERIHHDLPEA